MSHVTFAVVSFVLFMCVPPHLEAQWTSAAQYSGIEYDTLARNEISMWTSNIGVMCHTPISRSSGFEWPRGSGKQYIYMDGLLLSYLIQGEIQAGGTMYRTAWQPGRIYADGTAQDPNDPEARLYRVRRLMPNEYAALPLDEQLQLEKDYAEWPVDAGAPWMDVQNDGTYDPDFHAWLQNPGAVDGPAVMGDEMLWCIMNDLDSSKVRNLFGYYPAGLEMTTTIWAFDRSDCLGRTIFTRHRLINKGVNPLESAYFCIWSDPDVGHPFDDQVGIDTSRTMAYVYSGLPIDSLHGNIGAVGYLLLQGPIFPSPGDTARFADRLIIGMRNVPFTAFTMYANGIIPFDDPSLGVQFGAIMLRNNATGYYASDGPFIDPHTGDTTKLMLAGDPVTGTGWLDRDNLPPGDRRFLASSGPFALALADTQEVVYARIVAEGGSPIDDIVALRETADCIIRTYRDTPVRVGSIPEASDFSIEAVFPNPINFDIQANVVFSIRSHRMLPFSVRLVNILGQEIAHENMIMQNHRELIHLRLPEALPSGQYTLIANDGIDVSCERVVILR